MISVREPDNHYAQNNPKRPGGLTVLFVLTFLNAGGQLLSSVAGLLNGRPDKSVFDTVKIENAKLINEIKKYGQDINEDWIDIIRQMENVTLATLENFQMYSSLVFIDIWIGNIRSFQNV